MSKENDRSEEDILRGERQRRKSKEAPGRVDCGTSKDSTVCTQETNTRRSREPMKQCLFKGERRDVYPVRNPIEKGGVGTSKESLPTNGSEVSERGRKNKRKRLSGDVVEQGT